MSTLVAPVSTGDAVSESAPNLAERLAKRAAELTVHENDPNHEFRSLWEYVHEVLRDGRKAMDNPSAAELADVAGEDWQAIHASSRLLKRSYPRGRPRERALDLLLNALLLQARRLRERAAPLVE